MKQLIIFITLLMLLTIAKTKSAEIIPVWHTESGAGDIQDMELLKGGNQFIALAGQGPEAQIQIRNTEDGELVRFYTTPISTGSKLQITPDSTRVLMINGSFGQLRLLDEQFTILKTFNIESDSIKIIFNALAIDPVRPLVYLSAYGGQYINGKYQSASKILAYNYETGEHFKDLTEFGEYEYTVINVSNDGKYFASINEGEAYLKVWDLETMELIRDVQLYDDKLPNNEWWCDSKDIQFSKLNSDVVYYSGRYPSNEQDKFYNGIMTYNIMEDKSSNTWLNYFIGGKFILFDGENKLMNCNSTYVDIFDLNSQSLNTRISLSIDVPIQERAIYSSEKQIFIGNAKHLIGAIKYDSESNIETEFEKEIIISPNPTNNFVNIELNCIEQLINYQINDVNGLMIYQSSVQNNTGNLLVDFTSYPVGVYFVSIECNNLLKTYKIVKEG
ncbi:MAG: T9SS type A sorting domain-containing protein [Candidatus Kapaibacterium sp.]|nr:T9SS type A sorting domain-containing protein [Ignavibacteriota bacterium]